MTRTWRLWSIMTLGFVLVAGCAETEVVSVKKNITLQERVNLEEEDEELSIDERIDQYQEKLGEHPENPFIYYRLGQLHEQKGQLTLAETHFEQCLEHLPPGSDPRPLYAQGRVELKQSKLGEAIRSFEQALAVTQPSSRHYYEMSAYRESYYGLGAAYHLAGRKQEALKAFRKFIQLGGKPERTLQFTDARK